MERSSDSPLVSGPTTRVPGVARAVAVLQEISVSGPGTISDLSRRVGVPKSSMLGICLALVDERLLLVDAAGRYRLGLAVAELAEAFRRQPPALAHVGVTVQNLDNAFFVVESDAIGAAATETGAEVTLRSAQQDVLAQCDQIAELVTAGCDAIIVDAVDSRGVAAAIKSATGAGVVVVATNVGAEGAMATVTTDNVQAGGLVAQAIAAQIGVTTSIALVDGLPVTAVRDRVVGFRSVLRAHPHMIVRHRVQGDHSRDGGYQAARELVARGDLPDVIFAINDPTALGVDDLLREEGIDIPIYSVDGSASAVEVIARHGLIRGTAAQDPAELGRRAYAAASALRSGSTHVPEHQSLPTRMIDQDALESYEAWG